MTSPTWVCDECSQPTVTGWLICDPYAANTSPHPIAWGVYCGPHTPRVDIDEYSVNLATLDSRAAIHELLGRLEDKTWFANTVWPCTESAESEAAA